MAAHHASFTETLLLIQY